MGTTKSRPGIKRGSGKKGFRSISREMAMSVQACMNGGVTVPTIIRVVRNYYHPATGENEERDKMILHHYEALAAIEKRHADDCEEEKREYIRKAKRYTGPEKP